MTIWLPTWRGWILLVLLFGGLGFGVICRLYPFLAQNHPVLNADMVIVEGWMADDELKMTAGLIRPGQTVIVTGGPVTFGQKILNYDNYADLGAARLIEYGVSVQSIIIVPAPSTPRDRTYVSAQAARRKLEELGLFGKSANLYTVGAHARRSYMLFRRVFGKEYSLGVVAVVPPSYNLQHWYRFSAGVKHVMMEFISWIYAECFLLTHHA